MMTFFSYDHKIGGEAKNYVEWLNTEQFRYWRGERLALFAAYGVKPPEKYPKVGETLYAEFSKSHMLFEIMKVTFSADQKDTFFLEVRPIKQIVKEHEDGNTPKLAD
jgi:hypothetical protein